MRTAITPQSRHRYRWATTLTVMVIACLLSACSKFENTQSAHNGPQATAKFFDAKFTDVNGKIVDLSALRGKTVVVNFWSTWCPPCVEEMPMFNSVQSQWQDKNVIFVGIAADKADNVRQFLKKTAVDYRIVIGDQAGFDLSRELGNRYDALPFTLIINTHESIIERHFGAYNRTDLEKDLGKALK